MTTTTKPRCLTSPAWEVRALLNGATAIVRPVKEPTDFLGAGGRVGPEWDDVRFWGWECEDEPGHFMVLSGDPLPGDHSIPSPFGQPGTRLAFRETWGWVYHMPQATTAEPAPRSIAYRATEPEANVGNWQSPTALPSRHCRLFATTTSVRVVRLGELTEQQCIQLGSQLPISQLPKKCAMGAISEATVFSRLWNFTYGTRYPWHPDRAVWLAEIAREA